MSSRSIVDVLRDEYLTDVDVAEIIGCSRQSLKQWRIAQPPRGPKFVRIERMIRYRRGDVQKWLDTRPTAGGVSK